MFIEIYDEDDFLIIFVNNGNSGIWNSSIWDSEKREFGQLRVQGHGIRKMTIRGSKFEEKDLGSGKLNS